MQVTFNVPESKVESLVAFYAQRQGVDPTTIEDQAEFIAKFHESGVIDLLRGLLIEQAQQQARVAIQADDDLKETILEAEAKDRAVLPSLGGPS